MRTIGLALLLIAAMVRATVAGDVAATKKEFVRFCSKCHGNE